MGFEKWGSLIIFLIIGNGFYRPGRNFAKICYLAFSLSFQPCFPSSGQSQNLLNDAEEA